MKFTLLSLFPEILQAYFDSSILAKSVERGLVEYQLVNIRDFALDKHRTCDDAPYGGGYGMVLKVEPLALALDSVDAANKRVICTTPSGRSFCQEEAEAMADEDELVLICGRYEGIDQRVIDLYVHDELSIGDYVLSSGEVASMVIVDAVYRLLDGVITAGSLEEESLTDGLLEYPHYTRPVEFRGLRVPEVLLSGHHERIREWRRAKSVEKTARMRPKLLERVALNDDERGVAERIIGGDDGSDKGN